MPGPEYPMKWEPSHSRRRDRTYAGLIYRLESPTEMLEAECVHRHHTIQQALTCARSAADSQNWKGYKLTK